MLNLRVSTDVYVPKLLRYMAFSSAGFSEKAYKELLKHVNNQDKIKTEKFRRLVSYLCERNNRVTTYKGSDRFSIFSEKNNITVSGANERQYSRDITNVYDSPPEPEKLKPESESSVHSITTSTDVKRDQDVPLGETFKALSKDGSLAKLNVMGSDKKVSKEISALLSSGCPNKAAGAKCNADLSSAALPLSLHRSDANILTAAVVQDLNNVYVKAMESLDKRLVSVQEQGLVLYRTLEYYRTHPDKVQDWARQQALLLAALRDKTAVWWCEAKSAAAGTPTTKATKTDKTAQLSPFDKLKKAIEALKAKLQKKVDEKQKAVSEKKK
ncbi:uncharacterized protein LOC124366601 [Homalodisca vitripennis]|uniref:uncharacterized protein LOC124366601 n=1 Tax=Homalodisca vitripennis TaxID=197043 RepID=UPI001EEA1790|nr:uncharacterized protein LOC124366601 [Homalodisca vitripennis]